MSNMIEIRTRKRRVGKRKVRTGCKTCRIRHVKCDETEPVCNRCVKFGTKCDGYESKVSKNKVTYNLWPKPAGSQSFFLSPSTALFETEQEQRYFRLFCDKTALQLSGYFDSGLWSRLVLQACENDTSIRHAVVAIAALDFTSKVSHLLSSSPDRGPEKQFEEVEKHHRFAIQQYGIAIKRMRKSTSEQKVDMRTTLIGCILLICFETFHGNHQSAIAQVQSGLSLIEDWHRKKAHNPSDILGASSPSPVSIEDELLQALGRLDVQAMSFADPRPKETHDRMRYYGLTSINSMPLRFSSLKEARIYLELVMRRFMHFIASTLDLRDYNGCLRTTVPSLHHPDGTLADHMAHWDELHDWHRAFEPLLAHARTPEGAKHFLGATALENHYLCSLFSLDIIPSEAQTFSARSTPVFKEIVSLSKSILRHPAVTRAESKFTFDLQVVVPLYVTGLRCRHSGIRREAITLLLSSHRREGVWDSLLAGKTLSWVADIEEEEGLEGDFVPEDTRVVEMKFDFDLQSRSVHLTCLQLRKGLESPVERDIIITW